MPLLDPNKKHPMVMPDGTIIKQVVHLKEVINHPKITVGDFTYYHNFNPVADYALELAPFLFPLSGDNLIIGKFVQIAHGVKFITNSANHNMNGFSTFPFNNFMMTKDTTAEDIQNMFKESQNKGDTIIGNDVWFGLDATIMPGVQIGDGAIIGGKSVVTHNVESYTIGGNPAQIIKKRFDQDIIDLLLKIKWWGWPIDIIEANIEAITGNDIRLLQKLSDK